MNRKRKKKQIANYIIRYIPIIIWTLIALLPIYTAVMTSLTPFEGELCRACDTDSNVGVSQSICYIRIGNEYIHNYCLYIGRVCSFQISISL